MYCVDVQDGARNGLFQCYRHPFHAAAPHEAFRWCYILRSGVLTYRVPMHADEDPLDIGGAKLWAALSRFCPAP